MTKSENFFHLKHDNTLYHSCERATIQPISDIDEIDKKGFASNKTSIIKTEIDLNFIINPPKILRKLMKFSEFFEKFFNENGDFEKNSSENPLINSLIFLVMELLENNTKQDFCLNDIWSHFSRNLHDKPLKFVNNLAFLSNNKQKLIIWIFLKFSQHKIEEIITLWLFEPILKDLLKKTSKIIVFETIILDALSRISSVKYKVKNPIIDEYENSPQISTIISVNLPSFSPNFSLNLLKKSSIKSEEDPIVKWRNKVKTLNFDEFQEKMLKKETKEIEDFMHDSDFLTNFMRKYYKDTPSPKNYLEKHVKKHKVFLDNLIEDLKIEEKYEDLQSRKTSFNQDFQVVKKDFVQRLEDIQYMKSHVYPNDFMKEEEKIYAILAHLDYLFQLIDQIFKEFSRKNEEKNEENNEEKYKEKYQKYQEKTLEKSRKVSRENCENSYNKGENAEIKPKNEENNAENSGFLFNYNENTLITSSPESTPHDRRHLRSKNTYKFKRKSEKLFFERFSGYKEKKFKEKPEIYTTVI